MISPIDIATDGYLKLLDPDYPEPLIAIATRGYIIVVVTKGGGDSKKYYQSTDPLLAQALREDEEIVEIIIALTMSNLL